MGGEAELRQFLVQPAKCEEVYDLQKVAVHPLVVLLLRSVQFDAGSILETWKDSVALVTVDLNLLVFSMGVDNPFAKKPVIKLSLKTA